MVDWALGAWGLDPWGIGGGGGGSFGIIGALATVENVVRIYFTEAPAWTELLDQTDAANPKNYSVVPSGGIGLDGLPPRAVGVALVEQPSSDIIDVYLDRFMSPWSCEYTVIVSNLVTDAGGLTIDPSLTAYTFEALQAGLQAEPILQPTAATDFAHPDTLSATLDPLPEAGDPGILGGIPLDASGDYATDQGFVSYVKRIYRRLIARKDGYAHLPGYGAGLLDHMKQLGRPSTRQQIAVACEQQIKQEPETIAARVTLVERSPGLWNLRILIRTTSWGAVKLERPLVGV